MDIGDVGAGYQLLQILHTVNALGLQGLAVEHTDRRGDALGAFLAASSIDRDSAEGGLLLGTGVATTVSSARLGRLVPATASSTPAAKGCKVNSDAHAGHRGSRDMQMLLEAWALGEHFRWRNRIADSRAIFF